jgi:uncharacterized protein (TIGR03118 family)
MIAVAVPLVLIVIRLAAAEPGNSYAVTNLVSDGTISAAHVDPNLVNAWGIAFLGSGPWWVADNETALSTLYNSTGTPQSLIVQLPAGSAPTGTVSNAGAGFVITDGTNSGPARFMFASEDGTISGWNPTVPPPPLSTHAFRAVPNPNAPATGAIYKGLAIAQTTTGDFLYAADFHNNLVDVFNSSFHRVAIPGGFVDPNLPHGFAPFGIQNVGGRIVVTYAKQDENAEDEVAGDGLGFVSLFETNGAFVARIASRGALNAPWGVALAPADFGRFKGDLLIGNFGDGRINAFDATTFEELGHLKDERGKAVVIDGLWGLGFGNGGTAGPTNVLFFAAGPADETQGLFGRIDAR